MAYLRVDCGICGAYWNYYEEMYEPYPKTTPVQYQGCVCPNCGSIGVIRGFAGDNSQAINRGVANVTHSGS